MSSGIETNKTKISREEVKRIALLARLGINEMEIEKLQQQLSNILDNFEILEQVDTDGLPPTSQSISLTNVFRRDEACPSYQEEEILANAPKRDGNYFKVQAILE